MQKVLPHPGTETHIASGWVLRLTMLMLCTNSPAERISWTPNRGCWAVAWPGLPWLCGREPSPMPALSHYPCPGAGWHWHGTTRHVEALLPSGAAQGSGRALATQPPGLSPGSVVAQCGPPCVPGRGSGSLRGAVAHSTAHSNMVRNMAGTQQGHTTWRAHSNMAGTQHGHTTWRSRSKGAQHGHTATWWAHSMAGTQRRGGHTTWAHDMAGTRQGGHARWRAPHRAAQHTPSLP